jgi:hypothetical protein
LLLLLLLLLARSGRQGQCRYHGPRRRVLRRNGESTSSTVLQ